MEYCLLKQTAIFDTLYWIRQGKQITSIVHQKVGHCILCEVKNSTFRDECQEQ